MMHENLRAEIENLGFTKSTYTQESGELSLISKDGTKVYVSLYEPSVFELDVYCGDYEAGSFCQSEEQLLAELKSWAK